MEVCRICLASHIKIYSMVNTELQDIYEKLTSKQWSADRRPSTICYICYAQLNRCRQFREKSKKSEKIFSEVFGYTDFEFTEDTVEMLNSRNLQEISFGLTESYSFNNAIDYNMNEQLSWNNVKSRSNKPLDVTVEDSSTPVIKNEIGHKIQSLDQENVSPNAVMPNVVTQIHAEPSNTLKCGEESGKNIEMISEHYKADTKSLNTTDNMQTKMPCFVLKFKLNDSQRSTKTQRKINLKRKLSSDVSPDSSIHESVKMPYECHICYESFMEKHQLVSHAERIHTRRKYACRFCDREFHMKSRLQNHIRIHTGEKPFVCEHCNKRFRQKIHLVQHNRTHTGEKPYSCDECLKRFGQLSNLKQHQRIHTGEKPYKCDRCSTAFTQRANLKKHIETHH